MATTISGNIQFEKNLLPATGIRVELWYRADELVNASLSFLTSTYSDLEGNFTATFDDIFAYTQDNVVFKTYKGDVLLSNTILSDDQITITIPEKNFVIAEKHQEKDAENYLLVKGFVRDEGGQPATGIKVQLYQQGFRQQTLITEVSTDLRGYYEARVHSMYMSELNVSANTRGIKVVAVSGELTIASSFDTIWQQKGEVQIDLNVQDKVYIASPEFTTLMEKVQRVLGEIPFDEFASEVEFAELEQVDPGPDDPLEYSIYDLSKSHGDGNEDGELSYVAAATGSDLSLIQQLVRSWQFADEIEGAHDMMFALMRKNDLLRNPVLNMDEAQMRDEIANAEGQNFIPAHEGEEIDTFIELAQDFQVITAMGIPIYREDYNIGDVLTSILTDELPPKGLVQGFLAEYNREVTDNVEEFWTNYAIEQPVIAERAQRGLRIAPITGFQPEITAALMPLTAEDGLQIMATYSIEDWIDLIEDVSATAEKLCVPNSIKGDLVDEELIKELYAKKLRTLSQNTYPLTALKVKLENVDIGPDLIADGATREEVIAFITDNPNFDLRVSAVYDINEENPDIDISSLTDIDAAQEAMGPFQRLLRLTGGMPDAVTAMMMDGLTSALDITALSAQSFSTSYSALLGGTGFAALVYTQAVSNSNVAYNNLIGTYQIFAAPGFSVLPGIPISFPTGTPPPHANPKLTTLFGNLNYCACEQCLSVYSPAAYFTDILNFLKTQNVTAYNELIRRRPDLVHIDMTCKNTNTPVPYIDLVNELLERYILSQMSSPAPSLVPVSFQTQGTAEELAAHPEHIYKDAHTTSGGVYVWEYKVYDEYKMVYDPVPALSSDINLTNALYPFELPFSLPAEETRTYLDHLGASRYELMKQLRPYDPSSTIITSDHIYSELLGLTEVQSSIIDGTHANIADTWRFYGFTSSSPSNIIDPSDTSAPLLSGVWDTLLKTRLDLLIQQLKITYKEFLQFLTTDFLNKPVSGVRKITVASKDSTQPDTCDLKKLELVFASPATPAVFFDKLHRFVRLWNTNLMSVYEWDIVFRALLITSLDDVDFRLIGRAIQYTRSLKMSVKELTGWWGYMDIHQYVDYTTDQLNVQPSVYDLLYRNKSVMNPPLPDFKDISTFDADSVPPTELPATYTGFTSFIAGANQLKEEDLLRLLNNMGVSLSSAVTLEVLSPVYAFANLCIKLGVSAENLMGAMIVLGISLDAPVTTSADIGTRMDDLDLLVDAININKTSNVSSAEAAYLFINVDYTGTVAPAPLNIQTFYEGLRNELQKFPEFVVPSGTWTTDELDAFSKLVNVIYQHYTKEFNVSTDWINLIINPTTPSLPPTTVQLILDLVNYDDFVKTDAPITETEPSFPPTLLADLYEGYRYLYKVTLIAKRLKLNTDEFMYLFSNPTVVGFDFSQIPVSGVPSLPTIIALTTGMLQMVRWINLRDRLQLIEDQLVVLLAAVNNDYPDLETGLTAMQSIINKDSRSTTIRDLIGDPASLSGVSTPTPLGVLSATFPTDFAPTDAISVKRIHLILDTVSNCLRTGLNPATLQSVLQQGLTMDDAYQVLLAAKGKHTDEEWASIAKPLRDTLRKKQRDALLGFLINHPKPVATSVQRWRNENDVYAFFLIDVEMEACMKTSRIKQGISSVQLYMDRILLGIEFVNASGTRIDLSANMINQWQQWRAWYRIWEANRKIFLYPENWIEPELRDDNTVFFNEMQEVLFQEDVTEDRAQMAMLAYLRKLDIAARLEPVSVCDNIDPVTGKFIYHVLARTYGSPHEYYYRRLVDYQWTGWERLETEIKGNHAGMVVYKNKLRIYWLTFQEKQVIANKQTINTLFNNGGNNGSYVNMWWYHDRNKPNITTTTEANPVYVKQVELTLNWTEYKDGKWMQQQVAQDTMKLDINPLLYKFFPEMFIYNYVGMKYYYEYATNFGGKSLFDHIVSRMRMQIETSNNNVYFLIQSTKGFYGNGEEGHNIHAFILRGGGDNVPVVWENWSSQNWPAPTNTIHCDGKFVLWSKDNILPTPPPRVEKLIVDNIYSAYDYAYCYLAETWNNNVPQRLRSTQSTILQTTRVPDSSWETKDVFKLTVPMHQTTGNHLAKGFFYEDRVNNFFVRPVEASNVPLPTSPVSIASAGQEAAAYYYQGGTTTLYGSSISLTVSGGVNKTLKFNFQYFQHSRVKDFIAALNSGGVKGFLNLGTQVTTDSLLFQAKYSPTSIVHSTYPDNKIDFGFTGPYSVYNWELFFHTPMLIAKRLSDNQQFDEARKWYHYIFDPTSNVGPTGAVLTTKQRFWKFKPFYDEAANSPQTIADLLLMINQNNAAATAQVAIWQNNPFKPHVIAKMRVLAYMKNVVMCYLDNLIAWGDKLFRQDTIESINQATNLYILAANILGERPQEIPKRAESGPRTFTELAAIGLDAFSNALVAIENYIAPNSAPAGTPAPGTPGGSQPQPSKMFYYCLPNNPKLLGYWDTVANRLFNIRNCRNIDGQQRDLPLFDAPIDPAILVRAAAAGIDAASVLDDLTTLPMPYKFTVMLQKANELCNDVKALGGALLSALEKKDAEALALLRSTQEISVLESMKRMKQAQIDEANANIEALNKSKDVTQARFTYYNTRQYKNAREAKHLGLMDEAQKHQNTASTLQAVGTFLSMFPEFNIQAPFAIGPSFGGRELNAFFSGLSTIQSQKAAQKNSEASKTLTEAGYERRMDDWQFQAQSAQKELVQIDRQIIASQIRKSITEKDLATTELQIENAKEMDEFMRSKYTNVELYSWMVAQVSTTYFQSYQLAYDVAKRAEKCLTFELPLLSIPATGFIKFGYWDSLKKGLMSGEKLQYDLRKMELAYLEGNVRELELTKHVSLLMEDPEKILTLRETGGCTIVCTPDMFNIDYPGHYERRIKSISISIPCVAGPYTTIAARLTQSAGHMEDASGGIGAGITSTVAISTSGAQNDSGMFDLNFRDERYLPFEGTAALCTWTLSLMDNELLRQFDYSTIADVIVHVKYTARYSNTKESSVKTQLISDYSTVSPSVDFPRYFSLRHEFANAWFAYSNNVQTDPDAQMSIVMQSRMFPYIAQGKEIGVTGWMVLVKVKPGTVLADYELEVDYGGMTPETLTPLPASSAALMTMASTIPAGGEQEYLLRLKDVGTSDYVDMTTVIDDIYAVAIYNLTA